MPLSCLAAAGALMAAGGHATGAVSHGWKLKRVSLMKLVCTETARMEAAHVQQLPYLFSAPAAQCTWQPTHI